MTGIDPVLAEAQRRGLLPQTPMAAPGPQAGMDDAALMSEAKRRGLLRSQQADPTIADDIMALPGKAWAAGREMITGEGRREPGIEELPDTFVPGFGSTSSRMSFARDDAGKADIYKQANPLTKTRRDASGNVIATGPDGKEYYLNRPGVSGQDFADLSTEAMFLIPAAKLGGALGTVMGTLGRVAGSGAATGGASVVQDKAAQGAGSKTPVDLERAKLYSAIGAGAEALGPLLAPLARGKGAAYVDPATGKITPEGAEVLRKAGIDPETVTQGFREKFARQAERAASPSAAAKMTEAETLPVPTRQTKGMLTGSPSDQMFEDMAAKGAYGELASGPGRRAQEEIDAALKGNVGAIQEGLSGGKPLIQSTGEAGPKVQDTLGKMREQEKKSVDRAYDEARAAKGGAPGSVVDDLKWSVKDAISADHDLAGLPRTSSLLKDLESFSSAPDSSSPIRGLFEWRKRLVAAAQAGGEESVALGKAKRIFDAKLDDMLGNALIQGDEKALEAYKTALASNRQFAGRFKGGDVIEALTSKEQRSGQTMLSTSPEVASNVLFGSSKLFGGQNTARDVARLKEVLKPDSPEWNAVREEAWLRLARAGEGKRGPSGEPAFSGAKFATAIDNALRDHPALMKTLFDESEMALMQQFKRVAARSTIPVDGGKNFSNTAPAMANIVQNLANATFIGEKAATRMMAIPIFRTLYQGGMSVRALNAARPSIDDLGMSPGAAGGMGATGAPQNRQ